MVIISILIMSACRKSFLVLTVSLFATVNALENLIQSLDDKLGKEYVNAEDFEEAKREMLRSGYGYGSDWIIIPGENDLPRVALLRMEEGKNISRTSQDGRLTDFTPVEENVHLTLFTKESWKNGEPINATNLRSSKFDSSKPTKIIIHGWQSSAESDTVKSIRDAYLQRSDVNVISVDWSGQAANIFYPSSAAYTKTVGRYVASIIDELVETKNAKYEDIHIIGHSLGAHTAGVAGSSTRKKVFRITGLDPALPCFQDTAELEDRLDKSDGNFVEVIHTCSGALGMSTPTGHADFYPNGGSPFQPGCCCLNELIYACSHGRSHKYFAESISSEKAFTGVRCATWKSFKNDSCDDVFAPMGEYTPTDARGVFYLQTNSQSPYGLGMDGLIFHE